MKFFGKHAKRKLRTSPTEYDISPATGCWVWNGRRSRLGYGVTRRLRKGKFAHRVFWEEINGPVPLGLELDHLCRNPPCVNPSHLEAVTPTENKRRSRATKLTKTDVAEIKSSADSNVVLATRFGVDPSNISHIRRGFSWKDIHAE